MSAPLRRSVLIAENLAHADRCATLENNWRRAGSGRWTGDAGELIEYVDNPRVLQSLSPGTVVYLGWGWSRHEWMREWYPTMFAARRLVTQEVCTR